jgi:hypothetical protein
MKSRTVAIAFLLISSHVVAQDSIKQNNPFAWSVFADAYYSYDFNKPANHTKPPFLYSHNRHNEVTVNLAFLKAAYSTEKIRANLAIAAGTYTNANYATEPGVLKNIYEANVGAKISKRANIWVDAGIFSSHIGYESAHSPSCWALTRSIMAENSPYYEAGAKLTYTSNNGKWLMGGLLLNGWQRISRVDANNTPAFGTQLTYTPSKKVTLNWSTFVGNDKPDSVRQWRYFNNFYGIFQLADKWGLTIGFDIGREQQTNGSSLLNNWYTPNMVVRFTPNDNWAIAARGEYYSDENGVLISTGTANGFKTFGSSLNIDRKINETFWWRTEIRTLRSKDAIFPKDGRSINHITFLTTSFAIAL